MVFWASIGFTQPDIVAAEYFIDNDPGVGSATPLSVTQGQTIDEDYNIPTNGLGLAEGVHLIGIRTLDANGVWSMTEKRPFVIRSSGTSTRPPPSPVLSVEYFIDVDPGVGNGSPFTNFPGTAQDIDFDDIAITNSLPEGIYGIYARSVDTDGDWGFYESRTIYIRASGTVTQGPPPEVVELEYFFDDDPGVGQATSISVPSPGAAIDISDLIAQGLANGRHLIGIRAKDENGAWSMTERRQFYIDPSTGSSPVSKIDAIEYFFDSDPGIGNAQQIAISPAVDSLDLPFTLLTGQNVPVGTNSVTVRARNELGIWGFPETRDFEVDDNCTFPNAQFDIQLGCATDAVQFIDTSFDIIPTENPEYRWYLDGDNTVDDSTVGDVSWTYDIPGTYEVSLAIYQGQTCSDSMSAPRLQ